MTGPPSALNADYETILNAVLETARGRAFLAEHTRRNRQADTKLVLQAIEQLERSLRERPGASRAERMRVDLLDMANAIARARMEIAAIKPAEDREGTIGIATDELDAIVGATEKATSASSPPSNASRRSPGRCASKASIRPFATFWTRKRPRPTRPAPSRT